MALSIVKTNRKVEVEIHEQKKNVLFMKVFAGTGKIGDDEVDLSISPNYSYFHFRFREKSYGFSITDIIAAAVNLLLEEEN